jgi:hypothetical protein
MRSVPVDDAHLSWFPMIHEMIAYARRVGFHE